MRQFPLQKRRVHIAERYGEQPYRREHAIELAREMGNRTILLADFSEVVSVSAPFMHSLLKTIRNDRKQGYFNDSLLALVNTNEDIRFTTGVINRLLYIVSAVGNAQNLEFVPSPEEPQAELLSLTQSFTKDSGAYSIGDLMSSLNITQKSSQLRLYPLIWGGVVARAKLKKLSDDHGSAYGGLYLHRTISVEDLAEDSTHDSLAEPDEDLQG